jgi:hypothetical protein
MSYESRVLATLTPEVARHLSRECRHRYGDGFDTEPAEDGLFRFIGPDFARDFVEGFLVGLEISRSERNKAPTLSGEFFLEMDRKKQAGSGD